MMQGFIARHWIGTVGMVTHAFPLRPLFSRTLFNVQCDKAGAAATFNRSRNRTKMYRLRNTAFVHEGFCPIMQGFTTRHDWDNGHSDPCFSITSIIYPYVCLRKLLSYNTGIHDAALAWDNRRGDTCFPISSII
jgi:hypothetical protein